VPDGVGIGEKQGAQGVRGAGLALDVSEAGQAGGDLMKIHDWGLVECRLFQPPPQGTGTRTANWDPQLGTGPVGRTSTPLRTIDNTGKKRFGVPEGDQMGFRTSD
jgi:hypothetical protein